MIKIESFDNEEAINFYIKKHNLEKKDIISIFYEPSPLCDFGCYQLIYWIEEN